jgi:hypothetical protein
MKLQILAILMIATCAHMLSADTGLGQANKKLTELINKTAGKPAHSPKK